MSLREILSCFCNNLLGDPSSLPRTGNLLQILGSITVSISTGTLIFICLIIFISSAFETIFDTPNWWRYGLDWQRCHRLLRCFPLITVTLDLAFPRSLIEFVDG